MQISKLINPQEFSEHRSSALTLIAANVMPLLGVLFWGWSTFAVVAVYWAENVILGMINVLKMLCCKNPGGLDDDKNENEAKLSPGAKVLAKLFMSGFFTVHYGGFCFVHGMFVFTLLGGAGNGFGDPFRDWSANFSSLHQTGATWGIGALAISHLYSFVKNYLIGGEYRRTNLPNLMIAPYARIFVLHIAILFGAFAILALDSPVWMLAIMIIGKTALDLAMHLREHRKASKNQGHQSDHGHDRGNEGFGAGSK